MCCGLTLWMKHLFGTTNASLLRVKPNKMQRANQSDAHSLAALARKSVVS